METERYREAFKTYEKALAMLEATLGKDHPMTAHALCTMGTAARRSGDLVAAQGYCKRSLAILEKKLGRDHPDCAGPLGSLAEIAIDQGRFADALPMIERIRAIGKKAGESEDTASFGELLFLRGRALVGSRRIPEGLAEMGRGLELMKKRGSKKRVLREAEAQMGQARKRR
jgi:tetratricopeptide (TPR) repeat protein